MIAFRVVTRHYVSRTKIKYAKANRIYICPEQFTDCIERKYFRFALERRLYNKMIYSKEIIVLERPPVGGGALRYKEANRDVPLDGTMKLKPMKIQ